jgi:hypothetical protein
MDNQMKSTIYFFVFAITLSMLLLLTGCSEDCSDGNYKPYDCLDREPSEGILRIEATLDGLNPVVPIEVYYGDYENNLLYFVDTLDTFADEYWVPNGDYSIKAKYSARIDNRLVTIYSIDGGNISSSSTSYCDGDCYTEGRLVLNAKLDLNSASQ